MRRILLAIFCVTALTLAACSSSGGDDDRGPDSDAIEDPAAFVRDSVEATLATTSFVVDSELALSVDAMSMSLTATGPVDYEALIADVELVVDNDGSTGGIAIRSDGESLWVGADGTGVPPMPGGNDWVEGEASLLGSADSFSPEGLLGTIYALRAATDAEVVGEEEIDGVSTTQISTSFTYGEAVEAAGPDEEAFTTAFSLRGFDHAVIEVEAWIGDDGIIRRLTYSLDESDPAVLNGSYELDLTDVGENLDAPDAPDSSDVTTGPEAEAWLEANLS